MRGSFTRARRSRSHSQYSSACLVTCSTPSMPRLLPDSITSSRSFIVVVLLVRDSARLIHKGRRLLVLRPRRSKDDDGGWKRRGILACAEFQTAANEANLRRFCNKIVPPSSVSAGWHEADHRRATLCGHIGRA